jgi:DNA replication and repair protein RecF
MRLRELELDEFRSFRRLELAIKPAGFRAIGPNASGKSTLLEAIAMLATTRSPRTSVEREIPNWASGEELGVPAYARVRGRLERLDGTHELEIGLTMDEAVVGSLKKRVRYDGQPVRAVDAVGRLKTVLFSPEDVELISGAPAARRRFLDMAISQASRGYLRALSRYGRVLEQRNSLLRRFARERVSSASPRPRQELAFWDAELTATAAEVLAIRLGAVDAISRKAQAHFADLTGIDTLAVSYAPSRLDPRFTGSGDTDWGTPSQPFRQEIATWFGSYLTETKSEELRRGVTVIGPHRDDFRVTMKHGGDLGRFGSRGQQRLAVIAIKLAELDLLESAAGEAPVLLLDDVLSELDTMHRAKLVTTLARRDSQIIVTATEEGDLGVAALGHLPVLRMMPGTVGSSEPG